MFFSAMLWPPLRPRIQLCSGKSSISARENRSCWLSISCPGQGLSCLFSPRYHFCHSEGSKRASSNPKHGTFSGIQKGWETPSWRAGGANNCCVPQGPPSLPRSPTRYKCSLALPDLWDWGSHRWIKNYGSENALKTIVWGTWYTCLNSFLLS